MRTWLKKLGVWLLTKLAFAIGVAGISAAVVIVAGQCFSWMAFGTWPEISIQQVLIAVGQRAPPASSPGNQTFGNQLLAVPLSVVALAIGLGLKHGFMHLASRFRREPRSTDMQSP
jgi:hypothetical protein